MGYKEKTPSAPQGHLLLQQRLSAREGWGGWRGEGGVEKKANHFERIFFLRPTFVTSVLCQTQAHTETHKRKKTQKTSKIKALHHKTMIFTTGIFSVPSFIGGFQQTHIFWDMGVCKFIGRSGSKTQKGW